jgi:hypothetical protein
LPRNSNFASFGFGSKSPVLARNDRLEHAKTQPSQRRASAKYAAFNREQPSHLSDAPCSRPLLVAAPFSSGWPRPPEELLSCPRLTGAGAIPISGIPSMHYQFSRRSRLRFSTTGDKHSTTCVDKF